MKEKLNLFFKPSIRPFTLLIVVFLISGIIYPRTLMWSSISSLLYAVPPLAMMVGGFMVPLIAGEIDITLASMIGLSNVLIGIFLVWYGFPIIISVILVVLICGGVGIVNGVIIVKGRIPSFIETIAASIAILGVSLWITNAEHITNFPSTFINFLSSSLMKIPIPIILGAIFLGILTFLLTRTKTGRHMYATGTDEETARNLAIKTDWLKIISFGVAGIFYAIGGIFLAGRTATGWAHAGRGWVINGLAIAVLAGGDFRGGRGLPINAILAVLILEIILRIIVLAGLPIYAQHVFTGGIVILAALFATRERLGG